MLLGRIIGNVVCTVKNPSLEGQRLQAIQYKQLLDDKRRTQARLARADHRDIGHAQAYRKYD